MGLDMYLFKKKEGEEYEEIGYWCKHPNLHGHMQKLWEKKGGTGEFNCRKLELTEDEMLEIIELSKKNALPVTTGFYFGISDEYHNEITIDIMERAIEELKEGYTIYYDSWW